MYNFGKVLPKIVAAKLALGCLIWYNKEGFEHMLPYIRTGDDDGGYISL